MIAKESCLKRLKAEKVLRASELVAFISTRTQLRRMVDAGEILSLGSGFYGHPSLDPFVASLIATAKYYPLAVISNITSLVVHELSDERVDRIDVDIPRSSSIRNKLICAHRVATEYIVGVVQVNFYGQKIKVYSKERALCDAYKIDPDGPLFLKAVKRYVKSGGTHSDGIAKFDNILSTNALRALRQELADA